VIGHLAASKLSTSTSINSLAYIFECDDCDRSFGSEQSLEQQLNSPHHNFEMQISPLEAGNLSDSEGS
jgi:hypothetical protein